MSKANELHANANRGRKAWEEVRAKYRLDADMPAMSIAFNEDRNDEVERLEFEVEVNGTDEYPEMNIWVRMRPSDGEEQEPVLMMMTPAEAVQIARWILDNFGEP